MRFVRCNGSPAITLSSNVDPELLKQPLASSVGNVIIRYAYPSLTREPNRTFTAFRNSTVRDESTLEFIEREIFGVVDSALEKTEQQSINSPVQK